MIFLIHINFYQFPSYIHHHGKISQFPIEVFLFFLPLLFQKELIDASKSSILPTSLAQSLIEDKNAEIGERIQELMKIKSRVSEVITFITDGGNLTDTQDMVSFMC